VQWKRLSSATYYDWWVVGADWWVVGARQSSGAGGAARHVDAVNNGRQDIDQIYTAALTLKFAKVKVAVFNVWLPVGHFMR